MFRSSSSRFIRDSRVEFLMRNNNLSILGDKEREEAGFPPLLNKPTSYFYSQKEHEGTWFYVMVGKDLDIDWGKVERVLKKREEKRNKEGKNYYKTAPKWAVKKAKRT